MSRDIFVGFWATPEQLHHLVRLSELTGEPGSVGAGIQWLLEQQSTDAESDVDREATRVNLSFLGHTERAIAAGREILDALTRLKSATALQIADATGQNRSNCFRRIKKLMREGLIRQIDGYPSRYALSDEVKE